LSSRVHPDATPSIAATLKICVIFSVSRVSVSVKVLPQRPDTTLAAVRFNQVQVVAANSVRRLGAYGFVQGPVGHQAIFERGLRRGEEKGHAHDEEGGVEVTTVQYS